VLYNVSQYVRQVLAESTAIAVHRSIILYTGDGNMEEDQVKIQTPQEKAVAYYLALAKYYAAHPNAKVEYLPSIQYLMINGKPEEYKAAGAGDKKFTNDLVYYNVELIPNKLTLNFYTLRDNVCKKRVVGTRTVPEFILKGTASTVIPEHEEEIIEWDCPESLLKARES
jgi:hypothetical protein